MSDRRVEIYTDKQGRRRRRLVPVADPNMDTSNRTPRIKSKSQRSKSKSQPRDRRSRIELDLNHLEKRRRRRVIGLKPMEPRENPSPRGNPAVVETYEDARENQMINRNVPTMKHGGEAKTRGMGCAIKGGKFEGVF